MAGREITATTPLGADALSFGEMTGHDEIGGCYAFSLTLLSEDLDIDAADLLGRPVAVTVGPSDAPRHFHGLVAEFGLAELRDGRARYAALLRPWLWFLSNTTDNRVFQHMSVVEIVEAVFGAYPEARYEKRLQDSYEPREYCVQYGESDLAFVQRLMEGEGLFYFFEHAEDEHRLILTDANAKLRPVPGFETIPYRANALPNLADGDHVTRWSPRASVVSGAVVHTDYDFTKPGADLTAKADSPLGHPWDDGERYAYPGGYAELGRGDALALIRTQEAQAPSRRVDAAGTARGPWSGATFRLEGFPRRAENDAFMVLRAEYRMWDDERRSGMDRSETGFEARWVLAPLSLAHRPERRTPAPVMRGPQTATVVGPGGEEIFTDEHARVKVQFHWDRLGARDENSSCFVRVSSAWAGAGWGFVQIPRIGQEVIVDFLEGDPDQPIVTGRVYNAAQTPPYGLPGSATQSGWKSNSSPGGGGWNELRFEDKAGSEEVYFQAEKDHLELVKNDEGRTIGHDFSEDVGHDAQQSVGHDRTESVGNDKSTSVGNNRTVSIGVDDAETVGSNRSLTVGSNETISIGSNSTETIGLNHTQTVAALQTITVGAARVDSVGAAEMRTVGAMQQQSVGLSRSVDVGTSQSHSVGTSDSWSVGAAQTIGIGADQSVTIGGGQTLSVADDQASEVGGARAVKVGKGQAHDVAEDVLLKSGQAIVLEAADSITLKCGSATLVMKKDGTITLDGKDIAQKGSGKIDVRASGDITMKGSKINQN